MQAAPAAWLLRVLSSRGTPLYPAAQLLPGRASRRCRCLAGPQAGLHLVTQPGEAQEAPQRQGRLAPLVCAEQVADRQPAKVRHAATVTGRARRVQRERSAPPPNESTAAGLLPVLFYRHNTWRQASSVRLGYGTTQRIGIQPMFKTSSGRGSLTKQSTRSQTPAAP